MKQVIEIHPRVQVVIYDGQAPHPWRRHWVVLVDKKAIWHQSTPVKQNPPQSDCVALAKYIAQREASNLSQQGE